MPLTEQSDVGDHGACNNNQLIVYYLLIGIYIYIERCSDIPCFMSSDNFSQENCEDGFADAYSISIGALERYALFQFRLVTSSSLMQTTLICHRIDIN